MKKTHVTTVLDILEERTSDESPESWSKMNSHSIQRIINLQLGDDLGVDSVETSSNNTSDQTCPGFHLITSRTHWHHPWQSGSRSRIMNQIYLTNIRWSAGSDSTCRLWRSWWRRGRRVLLQYSRAECWWWPGPPLLRPLVHWLQLWIRRWMRRILKLIVKNVQHDHVLPEYQNEGSKTNEGYRVTRHRKTLVRRLVYEDLTDLTSPLGPNLPILGPSMIAPTRAQVPPARWTTPEPAKSWNDLHQWQSIGEVKLKWILRLVEPARLRPCPVSWYRVDDSSDDHGKYPWNYS